MIDLPWQPRTRQQDGARTERAVLVRMGAKPHPRSGAGRIKHDGSTPEHLVEVKDADKSFRLSYALVRDLFTQAVRQGKQPRIVVRFPGYDVAMTISRMR